MASDSTSPRQLTRSRAVSHPEPTLSSSAATALEALAAATSPSGAPAKACERCRERKVRCDRSLPECGRCQRRREPCVYVELGGSPASSQSRSLSSTSDVVSESPISETRFLTSVSASMEVAESTGMEEEGDEGSPPQASLGLAWSTSDASSRPTGSSRAFGFSRLKSTPRGSGASSILSGSGTSSRTPGSSSLSSDLSRMLQGPALPSPPSGPITHAVNDTAASETRKVLVRILVFGRDVDFEKVKLPNLDLPRLISQIEVCDSAYAATVTPNGLPTLFSTSRVPLTLYCASGQQAHSCISNYFSRLEPALELFVLAEPTRAFLRECADLWAMGSSPQRKGWAPMYLACLALGAMAMTEAEWAALGCAEAKAHATAAWLEEAGRLLVDAGIWHKPTVPGLRACLLVLQSFLIGLNGPPDVLHVLDHLPLIVAAAHELNLHVEPTGTDEGEGRVLWLRLAELQVSWAPLLDLQLSLDPASLPFAPARPATSSPASSTCRSPIRTRRVLSSPSQEREEHLGDGPLQSLLDFSCRLQYVLTGPQQPITSSTVRKFSTELLGLAREFAAHGTPPLALLLLDVEICRMQALVDESGGPRDMELEQAWREHAARLVAANPLACPQVSHTLSMTAYLHAMILIGIRSAAEKGAGLANGEPSAPTEKGTLAQAQLQALDTLRTAPWPLPLHQIIGRGIAVLEAILPA